jgi:arginine decarboxylase
MQIIPDKLNMCNSKQGLAEALRDYTDSGLYPMHMPGHKRGAAFADAALPWGMDLTEAEDLDDLHAPCGILRDAMARAAELYGSGKAFYLVNGSTCGILAGTRACLRRGETAIVARNSHRAVYHALELGGIRPVYILPEYDAATGITGSVSPASVREALRCHPQARLVIITSPTYEGVLSDVRSIADAAHQQGARLLVDEAHGAHLGFSAAFPAGAIANGADIVVHSLHKTLPALTPAALLHVCGSRADSGEIARQLAIFQTSSPSYPLMASMDKCVALLRERGTELFAAYARRLDAFYGRIAGLERLIVHTYRDSRNTGAFFARDHGKILILSGRTGYSGAELMRLLRAGGIALEMAAEGYALAMTSLCDTDAGFERLADALLAIDAAAPDNGIQIIGRRMEIPERDMAPEDALYAESELLPLAACAGRISAEYLWQYPPGIPLLVPGERVTPGLTGTVQALARRGMCPKSTRGGLPDSLAVVNPAGVS